MFPCVSDALAAQRLEMVTIFRQVIQGGFEVRDHIIFVDKGDLVSDLRIDYVARSSEVSYDRDRPQREGLKYDGSAKLAQ